MPRTPLLLLLLLAACKLPALPAPDHLLDDDHDGYVNSVDCAPEDPTIHPGAPEICDGKDDNCNGQVDENPVDGTTWYRDADGDTWGDDSNTVVACSQPDGYVTRGGDCDDTKASIHPGATDICNGVDDNCNGVVDEDATGVKWADRDRDGYGDPQVAYCNGPAPTDSADNPNDCNDSCSDCHPGAPEICDGKDNNCDGQIDDNATDAPTWCHDTDGDGHGNPHDTTTACTAPSAAWVSTCDDCNDSNASITGPTTWYADSDGDHYGDPNTTTQACTNPNPAAWVDNAGDCDDTNADVNPGMTEVCQNGLDDDCDPSTSCRFPATWNVPGGIPRAADVELQGSAAVVSARAGQDVYLADLDDDGYADLLVTQHHLDLSSVEQRELALVHGTADPTSGKVTLPSAALEMIAPPSGATSSSFADSFAELPDLDGNGWHEIVVGDPDQNANGTGSGAAELYSSTGSTTAPGYTPTIRFEGAAAGDAASFRMAATPGALGDPNAFAIAAPGAGSGDGAVYLISGYSGASAPDLGGSTVLGSGTVDTEIPGPAGGGTLFGAGLAFFHGKDGVLSLAVGAADTPAADGQSASTDGAVYIFRLPTTPDGTVTAVSSAAVRLYGVAGSGGRFGSNIANVGDVTGDGIDDLLISAPQYSDGTTTNSGEVYLLSGAVPDGTVGRVDTVYGTWVPARVFAPENGAWLGVSLAGCDVDGDGYSDILFGSPTLSVGGNANAGVAWLVYGGPSLHGSFTLGQASGASVTGFYSTNTNDAFGTSLACADVDKDGYGDVLVSVPGLSSGGLAANAGAAELLLGTGQ